MFTPEELRDSLGDDRLHEDLADVRRGLATYRLEQETLLDEERVERLGRVVEAVLASDYPLAQGAFLMIATAQVVMNCVADVVYSALDPRVGRR